MPATNRASLHARVSVNTLQQCTARRCSNRRHGASLYCARHKHRRSRFGHEDGFKIRRPWYAVERKQVQRLFASFPEHEGVRSALAWLVDWQRMSIDGERGCPGGAHMARLKRRNVSPLEILTEACAVYLFSVNKASTLPDDERLTLALAAGVLGLAPRDRVHKFAYETGQKTAYREPATQERKQIGNTLRLKLSPLFVMVAQGVAEQRKLDARAEDALRDPFTHAPQHERQS